MVGSNLEENDIDFVVAYVFDMGKSEQAVQLRNLVIHCGHLLDQVLELLFGYLQDLKISILVSAKKFVF